MEDRKKLFAEIEDFLRSQGISESVSQPDLAPCRYSLPFSFMDPDVANTCISDQRKIEQPYAPIDCDFLEYRPDCPYYEPDPNYHDRIRLRKHIEQLKTEMERLETQYNIAGDIRFLERAIGIGEELNRLSKHRLFRSLFRGLGDFAAMVDTFRLLNLKEKRKQYIQSLAWHDRLLYQIFGK